jgi:hypothetical protein
MWFLLQINEADQVNPTLQRVMDAFLPKYVGAGRPIGMAIFYTQASESALTSIYFSPEAASLAMQFGASTFNGEFKDMDLQLLVGDEKSIDYLFPNADQH